jgi:tetratricopeptide (TPR) repeat protein
LQKKRTAVLGLLLAAALFAGGCAASAGENTQQGFEAIQNLNYEDALTYFTQAEEAGEDGQQLARGEGIALLGLTRYEEAAQKLIEALSYSDERLDEFDYDTNYYLATAYFKQGDMENAEKVYSSILALREDKDAYYLRGVARLEEGQLEQAKSDFDSAIALDKEDYDLRIMVYQSLSDQGYEEEGQSYLQAALGNSDKKMSDYDKGRISYYMKDYESARSYLESIKNKDAQTVLLLGQTYEQLGDYNYAASIYSNYLTSNSDNVVICNRLGMCKLQAGDAESALEYFNRALELEDASMTQTLKYNQIVAYEYLGDFTQAAVLMRSYLQAYPDDEEAVREYTFLQSR